MNDTGYSSGGYAMQAPWKMGGLQAWVGGIVLSSERDNPFYSDS